MYLLKLVLSLGRLLREVCLNVYFYIFAFIFSPLFLCVVYLIEEPGTSVSTVFNYGLYDREIGVRSLTDAEDFSSILCVQTGSGAHSPSYALGTGVLYPGVKGGRGVTLTTHPI
jgi:hypothetical protein